MDYRWQWGWLIIIIGLWSVSEICSQPSKSDLLMPDDTLCLIELHQKSLSSLDTAPEKSREYALAAVELARRLKLISEEKIALENLAKVYTKLNLPLAAAQTLEECSRLDGFPWDSSQRITLYIQIAYNYILASSHEKAFQYSLTALKEAEADSCFGLMAEVLPHLGYISRVRQNLKQAREYYQQILNLKDKISDQSAIGNALNEIGNLLFMQDSIQQALYYKNQAINVAISCKNKDLEAFCYNDLGMIYSRKGNNSLSLEYFLRASRMLKKSSREYAIALMNIAVIYQSMEDREKSLDYYLVSEALCRQLGLRDELYNVLSSKSTFYYQIGKYRLAWMALDESHRIYIEIFTRTSTQELAQMQARYESEKKESEIELLKKNESIQQLRIRKQQIMRNFLLVSLVLSLAVVFLIYSRYRLKIRTNRELEASRNRLDELARHDPLTGLSNRRDILEKISHEFDRFERYQKPFTLIISDCDHFKDFNDHYGHDCGDFVLKMIGWTMLNLIRKQDSLARWGGEEFLILLPETDLENAIPLAQRICSGLNQSVFEYHEQKLSTSMTFGIAQIEVGLKIEELINLSDQAMLYGKNHGRNCVCVSGGNGSYTDCLTVV